MKYILAVVCFSVPFLALSQKREIRKANKMIEDKEYQEARKMLLSVKESEIEDKYASEYYIALADTYLQEEASVDPSFEELNEAMELYMKVGESSEKMEKIAVAKQKMYNNASEDGKQKKFKSGREKLLRIYELIPSDTVALYFATSYAVNDNNYEEALRGYEKLQDIGYTGVELKYYGFDAAGNKVYYPKAMRDQAVRLKQLKNPGKEYSDSKVAEITKNLALLYAQTGQYEKALTALEAAMEENPDDKDLQTTKISIYQQLGMEDEYKDAVSDIVDKGSDDPIMYARLGESAINEGNYAAAIPYLKKSLELDPELYASYVNLAFAYISQADALVDQLNDLPSTAEGNKKYDELLEQRTKLYIKSIGPLKKALELRPDDTDSRDLLINIYKRVGKTDKAAELEKQ